MESPSRIWHLFPGSFWIFLRHIFFTWFTRNAIGNFLELNLTSNLGFHCHHSLTPPHHLIPLASSTPVIMLALSGTRFVKRLFFLSTIMSSLTSSSAAAFLSTTSNGGRVVDSLFAVKLAAQQQQAALVTPPTSISSIASDTSDEPLDLARLNGKSLKETLVSEKEEQVWLDCVLFSHTLPLLFYLFRMFWNHKITILIDDLG